MSIDQLINPNYVAYVGVSENRQKVGFRIGQYLEASTFRGKITYVSPSPTIFGHPTFRSMASLSGIPDCVVIAVPARGVARVLTEAAEKGVGAAIILTSGFSEIGSEGEALQQQIRQIAVESQMVICGPNSLGLINFHTGFVASFSQGLDYAEVQPGPVAVLTQSGFFGSVLFVSLAQEGWGPSFYISMGNEVGVDLADALEIARRDANTRIIACYLEGVRNGKKLLEQASACVRSGKPVVVLRAGKSAAGREAAVSHTAAVAPESTVAAAALRRCGVIEVADEEELVDFVRLSMTLSRQTAAPRKTRLETCGIVTLSGGVGILVSDLLTKQGFTVPKLSENTRKQLAKTLPPFAITGNPVDVTGNAVAKPELLGQALSLLGNSGEVDCVIAILGMLRGRESFLLECIRNAEMESGRPMVGIWLAIDDRPLKDARETGVVVFRHSGAAVRALSLFRDWLNAVHDGTDYRIEDDCDITGIVDYNRERRVLDEYSSKILLKHFGVETPPNYVADSPEKAVEASEILGYPVVMKVVSEGMVHKSDIGGVVTGIGSSAEVKVIFDRLTHIVHVANGTSQAARVLVEKEKHDGVELLVGARKDRQFGVATTVGLGGVHTELFRDSAVTVVGPINDKILAKELEKAQWYSVLMGRRGQRERDIQALFDTCRVIGSLLATHNEICEIEINPLLVGDRGDGTVALDALVVVTDKKNQCNDGEE